jgi:hypothetical protein
MWHRKEVQRQVRGFDENLDVHCIEMRLQVIWSAEEITRQGIYLRDNPVDVFLA